VIRISVTLSAQIFSEKETFLVLRNTKAAEKTPGTRMALIPYFRKCLLYNSRSLLRRKYFLTGGFYFE